ncbi:flagellar assembly protein FliH [Paenalkalicoccus suaedae]|uniref:Flagellar assembly protein FliH n=1 Tax=Paenalkalicoccus suaedae TaxID=2592382 RepID=A0A859FE26_9BACI|nr:flagellar assembly protein FliH [Paenalkalicoccus suaedae]QKS71439.1 flagellar assembly protein FliH [Paenalkalicoccus suaedae]
MSRLIKSVRSDESAKKIIKLHSIFKEEHPVDYSDQQGESTQEKRAIQSSKQAIARDKEEIANREQQLQEEKVAFEEWKQAQLEQMATDAEEEGRKAAEEGFNQGFQEGMQAGLEQYKEAIDQAQGIVNLSKQDYQHKLEAAESHMLELALGITEKILGKQLEDESAWLHLVKEALQEVREQEEVKLYVHPDWYERTLAQQEELREIVRQSRHLLIYPDEQLPHDGCLIDTPYGKLDASVDVQLLEIKRTLFEKLQEGESHDSI